MKFMFKFLTYLSSRELCVVLLLIADLNPTTASTDTDPHPEFVMPKTPDSVEENDLALKMKVRVVAMHDGLVIGCFYDFYFAILCRCN